MNNIKVGQTFTNVKRPKQSIEIVEVFENTVEYVTILDGYRCHPSHMDKIEFEGSLTLHGFSPEPITE
jgi:hypothetical protein